MAHKNVDYKPEDIQFPNQKIVQSELVHEMQSSYIEYGAGLLHALYARRRPRQLRFH